MIEGEPILSPETARRYVLERGEFTEVDGKLIPEKGVPHTYIAWIAIASSTENCYLSEVYRELPGHRGPLSDDVLLRMAKLVKDQYEDSEE